MYNFLYYRQETNPRVPWFFENSKVPVILSYLAPIDIYAIAFGPWVWCRGEWMMQSRNNSESLELLFIGQWIHYHQQLELLFDRFIQTIKMDYSKPASHMHVIDWQLKEILKTNYHCSDGLFLSEMAKAEDQYQDGDCL